jgi:hypothetical protein
MSSNALGVWVAFLIQTDALPSHNIFFDIFCLGCFLVVK